MKKGILICLGSAVLLAGCYYDVEEELYPFAGNCDTTNVQYATSIVPILQSNGCKSCHSGGAPSGNISLETYTQVRNVALDGRLLGAVSHSAGFTPMPQGGNKLTECNINKIRAWVNSGAPEN